MIVSSRTDVDRMILFNFLKHRGVGIFASEDFQAIGRTNEAGELMGVVGFNGFCGNTACMHIAGEGNWVSREFIKQVFHYTFVQLKLEYLIGTVAANNERALNFDKRMGFTELVKLPNGWAPGIDLIVLHMHKDDCRWIKQLKLARAA